MTMRINLGPRRPKHKELPVDSSEQRRLDSLPNLPPIGADITAEEAQKREREKARLAAMGRTAQERRAALDRAHRDAQDLLAAAEGAVNAALAAGDAEGAIEAEMRRMAAFNVIERAAQARQPAVPWRG